MDLSNWLLSTLLLFAFVEMALSARSASHRTLRTAAAFPVLALSLLFLWFELDPSLLLPMRMASLKWLLVIWIGTNRVISRLEE